MSLPQLRRRDDLRTGVIGGIPVALHTDHRWTLPLLFAAQEAQRVSRPCRLIVFDRHHDALAPNCIPRLQAIRRDGPTIADLIALCEHDLRPLDDDWIKAAMELGLVSDAVVFGVEDRHLSFNDRNFADHAGERHRIFLMGLPGDALGYQGDLSDLARREELTDLWTVLRWSPKRPGGFSFDDALDRAYLTIDLDCFVVDWRDYLFPWPEEVYEDKFTKASEYFSTRGWTGKRFFDHLVEQAGTVDIAREPSCCGGEAKSHTVLEAVNRHLFDGRLTFD